MREIKFRAKDFKGNWVYGTYAYGVFYPDSYKTHRIFPSNTEIDEETLGQWTGLTDRNGKEIYEGDIAVHDGKPGVLVSEPYGIPRKYGTGESFIFSTIDCGLVARHVSAYGNAMYNVPNCSICGWMAIDAYQLWNLQRGFEVIGNIYENPELLEKA